MTAAAPSGVVTFLFTDVEGSTRRWEADADGDAGGAWPPMTRCCAPRSRRTAASCSSTPATGCAPRSPRRGLRSMPRSPRSGRWSCRCGWGMATGEAELRDGDYFGAVLNRAARVMAVGHGGQILLDDTTAGLLSSIDLIALGPRRLRDIAKPVEMFQVLAVGLRSEFPPLATLDATPGNLRPQTTSFIGREAELAEVQEALKAHRLVTLTGVGGVGKTRLATEVAARLADEFPDGVWVFELAAVGRSGGGARRGGGGAGHHPAAGQERGASRWPPRWRAGSGCWCSTTASTCSTPPPIWSRRSWRSRRRCESWPPAAKDWGSPTSRCGRCPRWMSGRESTLRR